MRTDTADRLRAELVGVEPSYVDVDGVVRHAEPDTLRAVTDALAAGPDTSDPVVVHRGRPTDLVAAAARVRVVELHLDDGTTRTLEPFETGRGTAVALPADVPVGFHELRLGDARVPVISTPDVVHRAPSTSGIGLFAPTYALWTDDHHGPSLATLSELAERAAEEGVGCIATLPLYAAFIDDRVEPFDPSPYAPVSRLHWNDAYLDVGGSERSTSPTAERLDGLVDWHRVGRETESRLSAAVASLSPIGRDRLDAFVGERPDVGDYARFRAAVARAGRAPTGGTLGTDPDFDTTDLDPAAVDRHALGQLLMHERLATLAAELRGRNQSLALDLPIGSHASGWETWTNPSWFATTMSVGAPPDTLFRGGQNWGFPPLHPGAGRDRCHEPWRRILTRAAEHADLLRIDHVMGVHRLWWIPAGAAATDGVYVRYPARELMATIAAVSALTNTTIVGEDLGTVPPEVGRLLADWDVLGMFEEGFVMTDESEEPRLPPIPARSVAGIRTHDMPAFAAAYRGDDISRPEPPPDLKLRLARRRRAIDRYRHAVAAEVGRPVADAPADVLAAALERLGRSDAHLVMVDLEDLVGETEPHNVPGVTDPVAWRRRTAVDVGTALRDETARSLLRVVRDARGHSSGGGHPTDRSKGPDS